MKRATTVVAASLLIGSAAGLAVVEQAHRSARSVSSAVRAPQPRLARTAATGSVQASIPARDDALGARQSASEAVAAPSRAVVPAAPALTLQVAPGGPVTVTITCDDGRPAQTVIVPPNGRVTVSNVPAGTNCSATAASGETKAFPPVPAGGQVSVRFDQTQQGAAIAVSPLIVTTGRAVQVAGGGFPPSSVVQLTWSTGASPGIQVRADDSGSFVTSLALMRGDVLGPRQLTATAGTVAAEPVDVQVVPDLMQPFGHDIPQVLLR